MGNSLANLSHCFSAAPIRRRHVAAAVTSEPLDEGLGHSFCYLRPPDPTKLEPAATIFRSISGAALSANPSTALSTSLLYLDDCPSAAAFDCSTSFSSIPLQPLPRFPSGPLSGPLDRAFLSGPIERSFLSGPIDRADLFSAPLEKVPPLAPARRLRRSLSHGGAALRRRLLQGLTNALSRTFPPKPPKELPDSADSARISTETNGHDNNLQWAQGKAGEDRVHVVVSEEHGWVFVGIYDGFNGPDATDYLLSNLYLAVQRELKGIVWDRTTWAPDHHMEVLKALSKALMTTEEAFLDEADKMVAENPELALMGSCVLVMLMKGEDVYLMNVGDSRAVLAQRREQDLERIGEESLCDELLSLGAVQLTLDHSTGVEEEVRRIRNEHSEDASAIANDRVKGSLKVTRAFGAGFLKQPKWNNALLEMFRIDYIGTAPYITCVPSLYHHTLGPRDRFLLLSSDGLYQYFTNEEAVTEVELFIDTTPEGDPAQHLVEEVLFRAAKSAGMDFHELLEIPQGDRRRYHDDVSIIVISLEGRIWSSGV